MLPAAPPPDTLGRLRALEAHVLTLGARSPLLAAWVEQHGILDETRQLFRDLPRVPYALLECPDALLYLGCVLDCWGSWSSEPRGGCRRHLELPLAQAVADIWSCRWHRLSPTSRAAAGTGGSGAWGTNVLLGPQHADYAWALRAALRDDLRWSTMPRLRPPALRRLLGELPVLQQTPSSSSALRLLTWAVELGPEEWLPLLLCTPLLAGRVGALHVRDALCSLWPRLSFRSYQVARATACLHAAHPGLVDAGTRRAMVLRERMHPDRTAFLLGMGMMDGWDRDPELGHVAATLGFNDLLLPFVWFSRLSELEWALVAHAARSLAHGAGAADQVRRWVVLRDVLRDRPPVLRDVPSRERVWHLPLPAARKVVDFLGLADLAL